MLNTENGSDTCSAAVLDASWTAPAYFATGSEDFAIKRMLDVVVSSVLLILIAPLLLVLLGLAKLDGGPGLFAHRRIGRGGTEFRCLKFRTMVTNADAVLARHLDENEDARLEWDRSQKLMADPRVTWLGCILRATSFDELPQLFNVLRGEMSLVGPRPVVRSELNTFYAGDSRAAYLSVRPGLTGLWQVSGRSELSYEHRVALDTQYVRNKSIAMDAAILWRTVAVVLTREGAC